MTATAVGFELDLPVVEVFDLREVDLRRPGDPGSPARAHVPDEIRKRFQRTGLWACFPCGEPGAALRASVRCAPEKIAATNAGRKVAVICHGGFINAYFAELLGLGRACSFSPTTHR